MLKARGAFTNLKQVNDNLLAIRNSTWKNKVDDFNDKRRCLHCMPSFETNSQIYFSNVTYKGGSDVQVGRFWWRLATVWLWIQESLARPTEICIMPLSKITLKDLQFSRCHNNWTGRRWKESRKATRPSPSWIATATTRSASKSSSRSIRLKRLKYILSLTRRRASWARRRRDEPSRVWTTTGETVRGKILNCLQKKKNNYWANCKIIELPQKNVKQFSSQHWRTLEVRVARYDEQAKI